MPAAKTLPAKPETIPVPAPSSIYDKSQLFALLSDQTRLTILHLLSGGERHVTAICEHLGQSQPAVSHHLALLRVSGLVESRRDGKRNFYSIVPDRLRGLGSHILEIAGPAPKARKGGV